jgi:class 3 adenylate cyclase
MGHLSLDRGDTEEALGFYQQSLDIRVDMDDRSGIANSLNVIGDIYRRQGKYGRSIDQCGRGYGIALEMNLLEEQKRACECLYHSYKAAGQGSRALFYLERMQGIEDSLHNQQTARKLQLFEFQQEALQDSIVRAEEARLKEEAFQAALARQKRNRNLALMSGGLFLLIAGGFYSRYRYIRRSKAIIEMERDRSESLILNILPAEIAKELKEKGSAAARDFDEVSVLFSDFKGFTEISETLNASELVMEINSCFEAFDAIMEKHGVEKIKTIGDAYMAAGGLPVPYGDAARNTVLAALDMQAFIRQRMKDNEAGGKPAFEMRVGIHTGPVVAGIVGNKKFQYDIWGDTVNTASRMESHGEVGMVNISRVTYEQIKDDPGFHFTERERVPVKGKGDMSMYFVERCRSDHHNRNG